MIRRKLSRFLTNLPGWRTNRKIVIIESDDWGSIRMPSKEVYEYCLKSGYSVDKNPFERYDSLASEEDLGFLFELLTSFKDKNGNHPIITANCVVANPNFELIVADNYKSYHYELITETFKRYPRHTNCFSLWEQGMSAKTFHPQYHGREHLNVSLFMEDLRLNKSDIHFGVRNFMPGCIPKGINDLGNIYIEATNFHSIKDKQDKLSYFLEGLSLFEILFGYKSKSIIPPNYIWSPDYNKSVREREVEYIQGLRKMFEPNPFGKGKYHNYYLGKKDQNGPIHLVRNSVFEPSLFNTGIKDPIEFCLADIAMAFKMNKPAIISSHRVNYVGSIDLANRDRSLRMLQELLSTALRYWPEIEFWTSDQLGDEINLNLKTNPYSIKWGIL